MRIAAFCFFAPAAFSLGLRRWLLGKESTGEALLHFGTAALWLNALALALLDARFHVEVPVVQALSQSGLFALKYLALTCALALAGVLAERLLARAQEGLLRLESLAPRHLRRRSGNATDGGPGPIPERPLTAGTIDWPGGWRITAQVMEYENFIKLQPVHKKDLNSCADYDKIQQYKPILRARMPGDRFQLPGRNCTKTLKKLLNEGHVPVAQRAALPLLAAPGGRVLWLCGQGFGAGLEPTTQTRQVLRLTVQRAETAEFEKSEEWNYEHE